MLCAKYDYKMDIAVKQEEAREDGIAIGIQQGIQQKAIEDAKNLYLNDVPIDIISKSVGLTIEQIKEIVKEEV